MNQEIEILKKIRQYLHDNNHDSSLEKAKEIAILCNWNINKSINYINSKK